MIPLLHLWTDPQPRGGPENMAVDEWLAETCAAPVLRCYRWEPGWGSLGYFIRVADLPEKGLRWVRRWTGGGIVDHRGDWTYTLFVPRGFGLAEAKGAESYRVIHAALAEALREAGTEARLAGTLPAAAGGECFVRPVEHDVLDASGRKIAGAGQRRTLQGLLHQGSVAIAADAGILAGKLAEEVVATAFAPDAADVSARIRRRYGAGEWLSRR